MYSAELKIPGGKLIRVKFSKREDKISDIMISGDFFLHPEDGIEELERRLTGTKIDLKTLKDIIRNFFSEEYVLIGAKPDDIIRVILLAKKA
ncbi:MAG: lipoate--protein ligase family protein [Candidatus Bathyarchaeota archaeon]|nr:lipoate--protein ligase family protein [Candidatus Bathyarchaeota archaeon]